MEAASFVSLAAVSLQHSFLQPFWYSPVPPPPTPPHSMVLSPLPGIQAGEVVLLEISGHSEVQGAQAASVPSPAVPSLHCHYRHLVREEQQMVAAKG